MLRSQHPKQRVRSGNSGAAGVTDGQVISHAELFLIHKNLSGEQKFD